MPPVRHGAAILLSAFLLFLVQPLLGQTVLPWFGGSAATWLTCLVAFQVLLLGGYAWAHLLDRLPPRAQVTAHLTLLVPVAFWLLLRGTVLPASDWRPTGAGEPTSRLLQLLLASVGPPYLLLAATTPLLQGWYARLRGAPLPYRLYALSNLGSFAALLAHPFLLQPWLELPLLGRAWTIGFALFSALAVACGLPLLRRDPPSDAPPALERGPPPGPLGLALWIGLPACASALLLAATNQLCQAVSAVPLLVLLPLALYLLSFVLCFEAERLTPRGPWLLALVAALTLQVWARHAGPALDVRLRILAHASSLFVACVVLHAELARLKPAPGRATGYYLSISAGGALGGAAVALLAPRLFDTYLELPLALLAALTLLLVAWWRDPRGWPARQGPARRRALALTCLAGLALTGEVLRGVEARDRSRSLALARSFYGALRVDEFATPGGTLRWMLHGQIEHGAQWVSPPARRREPLSYYTPHSGVGRAFWLRTDAPPQRVGVIGLGAGALACYARPGDRFRFYELDPLVEALARRWFTFLADAEARGADLEVLLGDGRVSLEREPPQAFDLLVVDAFSSDAVPTHLLTREALALYLHHLQPDGLLALHITNKSLDLRIQVEALARGAGLSTITIETAEDPRLALPHSRWALLARRAELLAAPLLREAAVPYRGPDMPPWRDAWCDILPLLR